MAVTTLMGEKKIMTANSGAAVGFWVRFHVVASIFAGKGDGDAMRLGLQNLTFSRYLGKAEKYGHKATESENLKTLTVVEHLNVLS